MLDPVAVIVPVLGRPGNVAPLVESYLASGARGALYFVADADDRDEIVAIREIERSNDRIRMLIGHDNPRTFPKKANLGYQATTEPWLLLVGDDVRFRKGWAWKALREAGDRYHLVATNDLLSPKVALGVHATHPLIRRRWVDEAGASWDGPGVLAHEGYRHWFVDDEWSTKARSEHVFVYAEHAIIEHRHHLVGAAPYDQTYRLAEPQHITDRELFEQRLHKFVPGAQLAGRARR